jgi:hypothetical protein
LNPANSPTSFGWKKPCAAPSARWRRAKCRWERSWSAPGAWWDEDGIAISPTTIPPRMRKSWRLREAGRNLGNHRLGDCELFATIEPCAMCAGAAVHARVRRLVYGADDPKAGAVHSILQVVNHPSLNHQMEFGAECWRDVRRRCCRNFLESVVSVASLVVGR